MSTKADYTEEEWQVLQWAVTDTMSYLAMADAGFWDSFKEATGAAKFIAAQKTSSANLLVRDLAGNVKTKKDKEVSGNPADLAGEVAKRVAEAVALIAEKDAGDVPAFKEFLLGLAQATAEAAKGVNENEAEAIEKLKAVLG
jgi:hypothetical protein